MAGLTITWRPGPEAIAAAILAKAAETRAGIEALAASHAARGEATMKQNAPWTDRTGNARQGLWGRSDGLTIYLGGTMDYQLKYLENGTSKMPAYPIIRPTAQTVSLEYTADAIAFVKALWG